MRKVERETTSSNLMVFHWVIAGSLVRCDSVLQIARSLRRESPRCGPCCGEQRQRSGSMGGTWVVSKEVDFDSKNHYYLSVKAARLIPSREKWPTVAACPHLSVMVGIARRVIFLTILDQFDDFPCNHIVGFALLARVAPQNRACDQVCDLNETFLA